MWFNVVLFCVNVVFLFIGFYILKERVEKKLINKDIIAKIKKEINSIIMELNNATLSNVTLVEEKLKELDQKIIMADKKKAGLKIDVSKNRDTMKDLFSDIQKITYSPEKIGRNSSKLSENLMETAVSRKNTIDDEIKGMNDAEKARYLIKKGWKIKDIQDKIGLSSGEMELLLNTENIGIY
jgi:hypothetical protein